MTEEKGGFGEFGDKLDELKELINSYNERDRYLRELNDKLYKDLKKYQDGMLDVILEAIYTEIIIIIRDLKNQASHIPEENSEQNYETLRKKFNEIPQRLIDMLYEHDVESYSAVDNKFEPRKQDIASLVSTSDPNKRNCIKESVAEGFVRHVISGDGETVDKVLKKEKVVAFKYEEGNQNE